MANNSTPDVFLLLGVEGGSNIGKGSGLLISTQLKQIMDQVEATITSHLKIKLDQDALSELKTQINDTVTEALTSIKGTPVELTFSFNQDSIDKAFRDVKKQLKEQNITISAQPQEKKKQGSTGDTSSSISLENTKKEAEATKQEFKEVGNASKNVTKEIKQDTQEVKEEVNQVNVLVDKMIEKISKVDAGGYLIDQLKAFKEEKKRAFSTTEIELFDKAIDLAIEKDSFRSVFEYMKSIKDEAISTESVIKSLIHALSTPLRTTFDTQSDVISDYTVSYNNSEEYAREQVWKFIKSRRLRKDRRNGFIINQGNLMDYLDAYDVSFPRDNYQDYDGNFSVNELLRQAASYASQALEYNEDVNGKAYLVLKDYEAFEEQMSLVKESVKETHKGILEVNNAIYQFEEAFKIDHDSMFQTPATYEQLVEFGKTNPEAQKVLSQMWKGWQGEHNRGSDRFFEGKNIFDDLSQVKQDFSLQYISDELNAVAANASEAQPHLDSFGKEIEDIATVEKEAVHNTEELKNALNEIPASNVGASAEEFKTVLATTSLGQDKELRKLMLTSSDIDEISTFRKFINTKQFQGLNNRETTVQDYYNWLSEKKLFPNGIKAGFGLDSDNDINEIEQIVQRISKLFPEISLSGGQIKVNDYKQFAKDIKEIGAAAEETNSELNELKQSAHKLFMLLITGEGSQGLSGGFERTLQDLEQISQRFPELAPYLQKYIDALNGSVPNPELVQEFQVLDKQAASTFDTIEKQIDDVAVAEEEVIRDTKELESAISEIAHDDVKYPLSTFVESDFIKPALQAADYANKMQSLNSDTADEAIDRVTESIEAQNDALRENTEAIEENQQAQKKAENTIPKSYLNDINKLNASQTVMSSRQGYDKVSTGASQTLGDINAIYQAIHDDNYDNVQAIGIENYTQAIEKLGQLLPLAKEQLKQTGKELDALDKKAEKAEADTAKANAKLKANAEKAEEAERKLASQLDVTIAKATARRDVLKSALTNIDDSQFKIQNPDDTKKLNDNVSSVSKLIDKLEEYYSIVSAGKDIAENFWDDVDDVDSLNSAVKKLNSTLSITEANLKSVGIDTANIPTDAAASAINKFNEALRQFKATSGANQYQDLFGLSEMVGLGDKSLEYIITETQRLTTATRQLSAANREEQNVITQRNKIYQEADNYYKKYQSGIRANIALNQRWQETLKKLHDGGFSDNESARRALAELQTATKDANAETMTLWGSLKKLFTDHFGSVSATAFIGTLRNVLRGAYQNVLEIDKAMTELRKVTNLTEQQYESFQARVADTAREVGGSIADTIRSTADYSRLGFNLPDSESLAKAALVYKNVGDGLESIDEASESIISTIKAFSDVNANDAMSIIDKFNEVGNNFAISSAGIGTALKKSAAALASANNTLDESIALITAGNTVVQNPEIIGTTMKTISMFLRAAKTEAEEAGIETEGMAESVSKLREEIKALSGVDIMLDDENYKSTYQILKEISEVWSEISDVSQANILEKLGGKRNANVVASVIENFDVAEQSLQTSLNAAGSALAENEKFLDSIAGHINKLTVAYEDLSQTVIDSDLVKVVVDGLTLVTNGLSTVIKNVGTLPTLISLVAGSLSAFKDIGIFHVSDMQNIFSGKISDGINGIKSRFAKNIIPDDINTKVKDLTVEFQNLGNATEGTARSLDEILEDAESLGGQPLVSMFSDLAKEGKNAQASIDGVYAALLDGNTKGISNVSNIVKTFNGMSDPNDQKKFADAVGQTNVNLGSYLRNIKSGKASTVEYGASLVGAKLKTIALTAATAALNAVVSFGISILIQGVINMTQAYDNAIQNINDLSSAIKTSEDNIKSYNDELAKTKTSLEELSRIENPDLFQKDELDRLQKINDELERKIRLERAQLTAKQEEARQEALRAWKTTGGDLEYLTNTALSAGSGNMASVFELIPLASNFLQGKAKVNADDLIQQYRQYSTLVRQLSIADTTGEAASNPNSRLSVYSRQLEEIKNNLLKIQDTAGFDTIVAQLDPEKDADIIEWYNNFVDVIDEINGKTKDTFTEVWESADYTLVTNKLKELAKQGKLTNKTFATVDGIDAFVSALTSIGITDISEVIQAIINKVKESGDEAEYASGQISAYAEQLSKIKDIVDSSSSMRSVIQDAYNTIADGGVLSDDIVQKFRDYPEIFGQFIKTTDGWTISVENLKEAYSNLGDEARDAIKEVQNNTISELASKRNSLQNLKSNQISNINSEQEAKTYYRQQEDIRQLNNEILDGEVSLQAYNTLLEMFSDNLDDVSQKAEESSYDIKTLNSEISTGASAFKEMQENGRLSISTFESLTSLGEDYWKTLTIENGAIKFNIEAFKDLTEAKVQDELATAGLALAEAKLQETYEASHSEYNYTITDRTKQLVNDAQQRFDAIRTAKDNLDYTWEQSLEGNETDTTDKDYQKRLDKLKEANKGTIEDEKKFVEDWTALNEEMYKATDPEKYEENLKEISDYIKGLDSLLDTYLDKWDKVHSYDDKNILSREARLTESRRVNYETYGDPNSTFYNLDTYEKNIAEQAKYEADTLKIQLDRGLISYSRFISEINRIRENARDRDGNYLLDMSFVSDFKDADKQYEDRLENLKKLNDKSIADEEEYIRKWKSLNQKTYEGVDNTKYKSNLTEIANYEKELLDRKYKEGLISAEEYHKGIVKLWEDNKELLGEGTQTEWLEDMWKQRAETEKTYWEQQKDLAAKYYDAEIKALQDVQKEEERISKAEELRLNLIKARQKLEEAKSQKNQLVFHDGTFEYMVDQDAIMSAEEEVAESLKAIKENELQEQIDLLEQQKDEALLFYSNIIGLLEYYINGTMEIDSSDSSLIEKAMSSESGQYYMRLFNNEITPDEIRENLKKIFTGESSRSWEKPDVSNLSDESKDEIAKTVDNLKEFNDKMQKEWGLGNVDLTKRPKVKMEDGSTATVLSSGEFIWQGDEENGQWVYVHYTPILPDGTILDDKTLDDYLYGVLEGSKDILESDANGKRIVLKVDADLGLSEEDIKSLDTGNYTDNIKNLIEKFDEWDIGLHNIQEEWLTYSDSVKDDKAVEANKNKWLDFAKTITGDIVGAIDVIASILTNDHYELPSTSAQDITSMAANNIYNDSNINNDNSVHVGDITMHIHGGTSEEMLNQFANKLGSAISTIVPKAVTTH